MSSVEKTVFISYRRASFPWALAVFHQLTRYGFDVFFDVVGIASGDFERVILENVRSRAHFLVLLTPAALQRCSEPGDWLRREIEEALACRRNIVPLMLEGFDFGAVGVRSQLTGALATLTHYNGLRVYPDYFDEAMARLRERFLNVPLAAVPHPPSEAAHTAAKIHQILAAAEQPVNSLKLATRETESEEPRRPPNAEPISTPSTTSRGHGMFTVCPECSLTLQITPAELRVAQGYVRCGKCSNVFNAISRLSEESSADRKRKQRLEE